MEASPHAAEKAFDQRRRRTMIAQSGISKWSSALDKVRLKFGGNSALPSEKAMPIKRKNAVYDIGRVAR
jgi:hypothetical protein